MICCYFGFVINMLTLTWFECGLCGVWALVSGLDCCCCWGGVYVVCLLGLCSLGCCEL